MKEAILRRYDVTEESYRQWFRAAKLKPGETNQELVARLRDLLDKWLQEWKTVAEIKDQMVLEQFLGRHASVCQGEEARNEPRSMQLADDYLAAHQGASETG